jgi:thiol:disulfide interchange protein DsbA
MNRRDFAIAVAIGPLMAQFATAATDPVAGKDYVQLPTPMPVAVAGKIEVIEFFGYWCPHCNDLEPKLEQWVKALPADVNFRRIPVAWQDPHIPYQKLFYALEAMGANSDIHGKVFKAFHEQRLRLDNEAAIATFAAAIGVDKGKLMDALKGFTVATKIRTASQQATSYQIEGVPTLAINGKFMTSPEMAKGELQALRVADALIVKARSQR